MGYLVGRHRKLGLVTVLGGAMVAGRLSGDRLLLRRGAKLLGDSAELGRIAELGTPLVAAARAAATSAVTRRIDSVSGSLRERTDLRRAAGHGRPDEADEADEADESTKPAERSRRKLSDDRPTARRGRRPVDVEDDLDEFDEDEFEDDDSVDGTRDPRADFRDDDLDSTDDTDDDEADDLAPGRPAAERESDRKRPGTTPRQPARRRAPTDAAPVRRRTR